MEFNIEDWETFFAERTRRHRVLVEGYLNYVKLAGGLGIPPIFENTHLRYLLGLDSHEFGVLLSEHLPRYRKFEIAKRSGGTREISAPIPALHHVQTWILCEILYKLPVSEFAHGGVPGRSILSNAKPHVGAECILKLDVENFYDNIGIGKGIRIFSSLHYPADVGLSLSRFCFDHGKLPQGAATSPYLSNITCEILDMRLSKLAMKYGLMYSRYFDDITFSGDFVNFRLVEIVKEIAAESGFNINPSKTRLLRGKSAKYVTGLSVGGDRLRLPRAARRTIKNEAFLLLKRGVTNFNEADGARDPMIIERILGKVSFWRQVEPSSRVATELFAALLEYRRQTDAPHKLPEARRPVTIPHP